MSFVTRGRCYGGTILGDNDGSGGGSGKQSAC